MIHFFTTPKPFKGHIGLIQENAIKSWLKITNPQHITLFGDEEGIKKVAQKYGLSHIAEIQTENSVPVLSDLFQKMHAHGKQNILCYINTDIILFDDFKKSVKTVSLRFSNFLMISSRYNLNVTDPIDSSKGALDVLHAKAFAKGDMYPAAGSDFFCFKKNKVFTHVPPFLLGRGYWDNWLIWKSKKEGATVVDATSDVVALHQNHDYSHVKNIGSTVNVRDVCKEEEGRKNYKLSGGRKHIYCAYDADCILENGRLIYVWTSIRFYRKLKSALRRLWLTLKRE